MKTGNSYEVAKLAISGLSVRDRQAILRELTGQPVDLQPDRIIRRAQVAKQFNVSLGAVDLWGKQGILKRIKLPGRTRAAGFRESEVAALVAGGGK